MAKHFARVCTANGYAAMGGRLKRPIISGGRKSKGDIKAAIAAEAVKAKRMQQAMQGKKK